MTTATESPFKSDSTPSNKCGVTLMNNQVGEIVAQVMATKPNVTVTWLPSMMRVDAIGRMDLSTTRSPRRRARSPAGSTPRSSRRACPPTTAG